MTSSIAFYLPESRAPLAAALQAATERGQGYDLELRIRSTKGRIVDVRTTCTVTMQAGRSVTLTGAFQDITERKQAEAARRSLEAQLRVSQKMEAIGTLASGIAHDFNNILGAIGGFTELARQDAAGSPALEWLDEVVRANTRATALVRQILAFSQQEKPQRQAMALAPVILEALRLLRAAIPASVEFHTSFAPDAHAVLANATQIHQIIMNLGSNAAHALRDRTGRLTLTLENVTRTTYAADMPPELGPGPYVRLSVSDTGRGMDQATAERIFEPFFTTKGPGEGSGLGLSVVHGIVCGHEGAITARSQLGQGTTFDLYFPATSVAPPEAVRAAPTTPTGAGEHILFVDDEPALARIGRTILQRLGYVVDVQNRPELALAAVHERPDAYALIITDLTMPGLLGTELARRAREINPTIPVLLITGYLTNLSPAEMSVLGIREILLKPFSADELGRATHRALRRPPAQG